MRREFVYVWVLVPIGGTPSVFAGRIHAISAVRLKPGDYWRRWKDGGFVTKAGDRLTHHSVIGMPTAKKAKPRKLAGERPLTNGRSEE